MMKMLCLYHGNMIGKVNKAISIRQLYKYAEEHNYLDADAEIVLDIIRRDISHNISNNINIPEISPLNDNISTIDFDNLVEYNINDLITLLSL